MREVSSSTKLSGRTCFISSSFADDVVAVFHEHDEQVNGFRRKRHDLAVAQQQAFVGVEPERAEFIGALWCQTHFSSIIQILPDANRIQSIVLTYRPSQAQPRFRRGSSSNKQVNFRQAKRQAQSSVRRPK